MVPDRTPAQDQVEALRRFLRETVREPLALAAIEAANTATDEQTRAGTPMTPPRK